MVQITVTYCSPTAISRSPHDYSLFPGGSGCDFQNAFYNIVFWLVTSDPRPPPPPPPTPPTPPPPHPHPTPLPPPLTHPHHHPTTTTHPASSNDGQRLWIVMPGDYANIGNLYIGKTASLYCYIEPCPNNQTFGIKLNVFVCQQCYIKHYSTPSEGCWHMTSFSMQHLNVIM